MTSIWRHDEDGWRLSAPEGFPDEATLHDLVEEAPQLLPLAGSPELVVVGREVRLGTGYADLIAVEPTGRPVVIEVKLAANSEARRAVIGQVIAYASVLYGMTLETLEEEVLGSHLRNKGHLSLSAAVAAEDQQGSLDTASFEAALRENLTDGRFRIVIVLDSAPPELVRIAAYLEAISGELLIDLVTVSSHRVGETQILVPQRVDPERHDREEHPQAARARDRGYLAEGVADFVAGIDQATPADQPVLRKLAEWAISLEDRGLVRLSTYHGTLGRMTLLPRLKGDDVGLVTIWNDGGASISFWRSVFERRAPNSLAAVEAAIDPTPLGQGNTTRTITDELIAAIDAAYVEAAAS